MYQKIGQAYHDLPWEYDKGEEVAVLFRTDREVLEGLLPPVLELPPGPGFAMLMAAHHRRSSFGPYVGIYLGMLATHAGKPVLHRLTGMKSDFAGAAAGRELWGMPLDVGEPSMTWDGDVLNVVARRHGNDFARLSVRLERRTAPPVSHFSNMTSVARRQSWDTAGKRNILLGTGVNPADPDDMIFWKASSILKLVGGDPGDDWSILPVHEIVETTFSFGGQSALTGPRELEQF